MLFIHPSQTDRSSRPLLPCPLLPHPAQYLQLLQQGQSQERAVAEYSDLVVAQEPEGQGEHRQSMLLEAEVQTQWGPRLTLGHTALCVNGTPGGVRHTPRPPLQEAIGALCASGFSSTLELQD